MNRKIKIIKLPPIYGFLTKDSVHEVQDQNEYGVKIIFDGDHYFLWNEEYEWIEDENSLHESKLSLDENNGEVENAVRESSNSLKKHGYEPIVNEVSYYEVSTFDASYILHEHLESIGYEIARVWFDQESKTFRAIKKKV